MDASVFNAKEERIFHFILKKALGHNLANCQLVSLIRTGKKDGAGDLCLSYLPRSMDLKILLLGEPGYIELYLKHYPIVSEPFLLSGCDEIEA